MGSWINQRVRRSKSLEAAYNYPRNNYCKTCIRHDPAQQSVVNVIFGEVGCPYHLVKLVEQHLLSLLHRPFGEQFETA